MSEEHWWNPDRVKPKYSDKKTVPMPLCHHKAHIYIVDQPGIELGLPKSDT